MNCRFDFGCKGIHAFLAAEISARLADFSPASGCKIRGLLRNVFAQRNLFSYNCRKSFAMPVSKNALIRYKTIDKCLRNRYRRWTLDDLIDACSDALYEYEAATKACPAAPFNWTSR